VKPKLYLTKLTMQELKLMEVGIRHEINMTNPMDFSKQAMLRRLHRLATERVKNARRRKNKEG
jgi:hypothetical protein